jgi:hypothetical protein
VIIVCAWCKQEGKPAVLYKTLEDDSSAACELYSHGICQAHRDQFLIEMQIALNECVPTQANSLQVTSSLNRDCC